ncbi:MAG: aminotransferase class I/II-fold pyridoxal phosphate-dependent enzyme [Candidatus Bathyarchaeia archaeon]
MGVALTDKKIVDELYTDVLNTVGNSPNIVQIIGAELLSKNKEKLEEHKQKWTTLKKQTETWLTENDLDFFPSKAGVTYWMKTPVKDTHKWTNEHTIPRHSLAAVPGTFFLFKNDYTITRTNRIRLGLGHVNPDEQTLAEALGTLKIAMKAN